MQRNGNLAKRVDDPKKADRRLYVGSAIATFQDLTNGIQTYANGWI